MRARGERGAAVRAPTERGDSRLNANNGGRAANSRRDAAGRLAALPAGAAVAAKRARPEAVGRNLNASLNEARDAVRCSGGTSRKRKPKSLLTSVPVKELLRILHKDDNVSAREDNVPRRQPSSKNAVGRRSSGGGSRAATERRRQGAYRRKKRTQTAEVAHQKPSESAQFSLTLAEYEGGDGFTLHFEPAVAEGGPRDSRGVCRQFPAAAVPAGCALASVEAVFVNRESECNSAYMVHWSLEPVPPLRHHSPPSVPQVGTQTPCEPVPPHFGALMKEEALVQTQSDVFGNYPSMLASVDSEYAPPVAVDSSYAFCDEDLTTASVDSDYFFETFQPDTFSAMPVDSEYLIDY